MPSARTTSRKGLSSRPRRALWFVAGSAAWLSLSCAASSNDGSSPSGARSNVCSGASRAEIDALLLERRNVLGVAEVFRQVQRVSNDGERVMKLTGVRILYRPARGLSAEWLRVLATCDEMPLGASQHSDCPFELLSTSVEVRSTGAAFAVDLFSDDTRTAEEVVRRAYKLRP